MDTLSVINDGLVRLGASPISSMAEASAQSIGASNIYPRERRAALAEFPWSFALRETSPSKLSAPTEKQDWSGFKHVYELPVDRVRVMGLRSHGTYWITGSQLHTDDEDPRLVYVTEADESHWPSWFARVVALRFAAAAAVMITDSTTRAELMYNEAQRAMQTARALDAQQVPKYVLDLAGIYRKRSHNPLAGA